MLTMALFLRWRTAAALLATVLLAACSAPMEFTSPVGEPGSVAIDPRLVGAWYGITTCRQAGDNPSPCARAGDRPALLTILHIALAPGGKELQAHASAVALDLGDFRAHEQAPFAGRVLQLEATVFPASVDGRTVYNVRRHAGVGYDYTAPGEQPHYMIAELELGTDDSLEVRLLWPFGDLQLAGTGRAAQARGGFSYGIARASSEQLMDMLRRPDHDAMFPWTYGPFRRASAGFTAAGLETDLHVARSLRLDPALQALAWTAKRLAELGFADRALESARLALAIDASMPSDPLRPSDWPWGDRVEALGWVAEAQAIAGNAQGAQATIDRTQSKSGFGPQRVSPAFVAALTRVGKARDALALAEALQDPQRRAAALTAIALVQATTGDHAGALRTLHAVGWVWSALEVSEALVRKGDEPGAREVLAEAAVLAVDDRVYLVIVAREQMDAGDIDAARATARRAASAPAKARGLEKPDEARKAEVTQQIQIAELQAELGDLDGARESFDRARQQVSGGLSREPLSGAYVVALQLRLGDRDGARKTQEHMISTDGEPGAIARAYVAIGDVPAAIAVAQKQGAWSMYEIADMQRLAGDRKGERETLRLAFLAVRAEVAAAREKQTSDPSPRVIADWALIHSRAGDREAAAILIAAAADRARKLGKPGAQVDALLDVAEAQRKTEDVRGAQATALDALARARNISTEGPSEFRDMYGLLQLLRLPELKPSATEE